MNRPFVGRPHELAALKQALDEIATPGNGGRVVLLSGPPGIGKTRTVETFVESVVGPGVSAYWGRCYEGDGAPPYWPWVQVLRAVLRLSPQVRTSAVSLPWAKDLAVLHPSLRDVVGKGESIGTHEPDRFRVFESVLAGLVSVAGHGRPIVILDDLHRADFASLQLLRFVTHNLSTLEALILGTFREASGPPSVDWSLALAELLRSSSVRVLSLPPLSPAEVGDLLAAESSSPAELWMVDKIYQLTEGNPLFVSEYLRVLRAQPASAKDPAARLPVPTGVQGILRQRFAAIPEGVLPLLRMAAVLGREFDHEVLQAMVARSSEAGDPHGHTWVALEAALRADILGPAPAASRRYAFAHVLLRDALYDDVEMPHLRVLHALAADAMQGLARPDAYRADIAAHRLRAYPACAAPQVLEAVRAAGNQAMQQLAYEAAAEFYRSGLEFLDRVESVTSEDPSLAARRLWRADLSIRLGEAEQLTGRSEESRLALDEAWAAAMEAGDPELIARTAVVSKEPDRSADGDGKLLDRLRRAAQALPDDPTALRVQVLACLANESARIPGRRAEGAAIADEAVALACRLGDPLSLSLAYRHWYDAAWSLDNLEARMAVAAELLALALRADHRQIELEGLRMRIAIWLELGNMTAADHDIDAFERAAQSLRQLRWLWWVPVFRGTRVLLQGRFAEARQLAQEALDLGQQSGQHDALPNVGSQLLGIQVLSGEIDAAEARAALAVFARTRTWNRGFAAAEAYLLSEVEAIDEARAALERLAQHDFDDFEPDSAWPSAMSFLARACAVVGTPACALRLYERLLPYAGRTVTNPSATFCYGAVDELLGLLATRIERWPVAYAHFDVALRENRRMQAWPFVALAQYGLACLHRCAPQGDLAQAHELAGQAHEAATSLGMRRLAQRCARLLEDPPGPVAAVPAPSGSASFQRHDNAWRLEFACVGVSVRHSKGMDYVAALLRQPGDGIHVLELVDTSSAAAPSRAQARLESDAGMRAWRAGRQRLAVLRALAEEAEQEGDLRRAASLQAESRAVAASLAAGLGGGEVNAEVEAAAQRARWSVTKRIKDALSRIAEVHPLLGDHLTLRIRTGTICRYIPDPREPLQWRL